MTKQNDPQIARLIDEEHSRQKNSINLIASENYASLAVREASASVLTNKYAEGYPGKRYYAGCEIIDEVERTAIQRCKDIFHADHVNVQPHAGSQANMAVYYAALQPGDTIMGMSLAEGGHLTHGHPVNISGKFFSSVQYTVNKETELLDYDAIEKLAHEHKPKLIIAGASAYSRAIDFEKFAAIAKNVGAYLLADIAHISGLIAADLHQNPVGHADFITSTTHKTLRGPRGGLAMCKQEHASALDRAIMPGTQGGPFMHTIAAKAVAFAEAKTPEFKAYQQDVIGNAQNLAHQFKELGYRIVADGTDNHMFVIDLRSKGLNGKIAENTLQKIGVTASRSCIPFEPEKPWVTSGIRFGTPAMTTRGLTKNDMQQIAQFVDEALMQHENEQKLTVIREEITQFAAKLPLL